MKHMLVRGALISIFLMSAGTALAEAPSFDPDQPFRQSFSSQMLRTLLNQALDILDDHLEVAGDVSRWSPGVNEGKSMPFADN